MHNYLHFSIYVSNAQAFAAKQVAVVQSSDLAPVKLFRDGVVSGRSSSMHCTACLTDVSRKYGFSSCFEVPTIVWSSQSITSCTSDDPQQQQQQIIFINHADLMLTGLKTGSGVPVIALCSRRLKPSNPPALAFPLPLWLFFESVIGAKEIDEESLPDPSA